MVLGPRKPPNQDVAPTCSIKDLSFRKAFPTLVMVDTERSMAAHRGAQEVVCFGGEDEGERLGSKIWAVTEEYYTVMALQLAMRLVVSITTGMGVFGSKFK